jgi:hypothetical protein
VYLAESLSEEINRNCITSKINTLEEEITIEPPKIELQELEIDDDSFVRILTATPIEDQCRLSKLREQLRTDHLNSQEKVS